MKTTLLLALSATILISSNTLAQSVYSGKTASAMPTYIGELTTNVGTGYGEYRTIGTDALEVSQPATIGTVFMTEYWATGKLYIIQERMLEANEFKYDIEHNQFLLKTTDVAEPTPNQLRVIFSHTVDAFELEDPVFGKRFFVNAANAGLTANGQPATGFLEVLTNGDKLNLYRKVDTELLRASYNVALNMGNKTDRIIKKETYYVKYNDAKTLLPTGKNRKQNRALFTDHQSAVDEYMKTNQLNFKSAADLAQLINYYNSL